MITIPNSELTQILNLIAIAGIATTLVLVVYGWFVLPDIIPVHFDFAGRVNGWGNKTTLWILPIIGIVVYIGFTFLRRYPHTFNYLVEITEQNAFRQYQIACLLLDSLKAELAWLLAFTTWLTLHLAKDGSQGWEVWILPIILIIIFGTIGFWLRESFIAR